MASLAFSIAVSRSEIECSNPFFLSSAKSNSFPQYSFFESSSACSTLSVATISSIILMTFSNPIFFPCNARDNNSNCAFLGLFCMTCSSSVNALARKFRADTSICMKLEALGKVFLKSSSASSSFSTLMVSAKAANSSARVLTITSHSFFFFFTVFLQVCKELCVLCECLLRVTNVVFHFSNFDAQIANPCQLGFYFFRQGNHLLFLRCHQFFVSCNSCFLCLGGFRESSGHLVTHGLQNPYNLTTLWCIVRTLTVGQECQQILAVVIHHISLAGSNTSQNLCRICLQECSCHPFFQSSHSLCNSCDVFVCRCLFGGISCRFLLSDCGCLCHRRLGGSSVFLSRLQLLFQNHHLLLACFDLIPQLRNAVPSTRNACLPH